MKSTPRWAWGWIALFLLIGSVPVIAGLLLAPEGRAFTGVLYNPLDLNSYLANMQQGRQGAWLYVLPYTAPRSTPVPLFSVYLLLGHVARLTALSLPAVFHLARIACAGVFAFTAYQFIAHFLPDDAERKSAFGLLLFTGGLGWLVIVIFGADLSDDLLEIPDYWVSDAVSFGAMMANPHFTLNMTFMMGLLLAGERFFQHGERRAFLPALLAGVGIALVHAHQLAVVGLVVGLHWLLRGAAARRILWREGWRIAAVFVPVGALAGALTWLTWRDDLLASWLAQGNTFAPPVWSVVFILYGPLFALAAAGGLWIARRRDARLYPVALWFGVVLALIYLPVNFQRRFMEGWHVPVVMLAALAWHRALAPWLAARWTPRAAHAAGAVGVGLLTLTPLFIVTQGLVYVLDPDSSAYLDEDTDRALAWLRDHAEGDDTVVFTSFDSGNLIPAWTTARTTLGHWSLTAFVADRWDEAERFFDAATPDPDRVAMLRQLNVDYVYVGEAERESGRFDPAGAGYLAPVFTSDTVAIYRFQE